MQSIKRGDVFYCEGSPEAIGSEERKARPVVIIQNDTGNAYSPTVIVANLTTARPDRKLYPMQFDVNVPGLHASRVLCEQIRTVDKTRLREKAGELSEDELRRLDQCLAVSFGMGYQTPQDAPGRPRRAAHE